MFLDNDGYPLHPVEAFAKGVVCTVIGGLMAAIGWVVSIVVFSL